MYNIYRTTRAKNKQKIICISEITYCISRWTLHHDHISGPSRAAGLVSLFVCVSKQQQHKHTQLFNGPLSRTTRVSQYQKGKTNLDFTEARQRVAWHQLGCMQVCTSWQHTDNHASTPPLSFFTGRMPFLPPNQQHQSNEGKQQQLLDKMTDLTKYCCMCFAHCWW